MTVSCKEHKQSWDQAKGSYSSPSFQTHRLQPWPLWYFASAPMSSKSLLHGWGWSSLLHGEHAFTVLQDEEETQWGCPRSWSGSSVTFCGCRLWREVASQLALLQWATLSLLWVLPGNKSAAVGAVSGTCRVGMSDLPCSPCFPHYFNTQWCWLKCFLAQCVGSTGACSHNLQYLQALDRAWSVQEIIWPKDLSWI